MNWNLINSQLIFFLNLPFSPIILFLHDSMSKTEGIYMRIIQLIAHECKDLKQYVKPSKSEKIR